MSDSTLLTQCPKCRSRFYVEPRHEGRSARCPNCKQAFKVEPLEQQYQPETPHNQSIGVNCRLCGTRLYGRHDQVGQPLTCPDCNTQTILIAPKAKPASRVPAAMQGDQYEVWQDEQQPWGSQLAAQQQAMVPVHCEVCETLQYVAPDMVGKGVECPDCGHITVVRAPKPKPAPKVVDEDLELEPIQIDESYAPPAPPLYAGVGSFEAMSQEDQQTAMSRVATNRKARGKINSWPLLTGWGAFMASPGVRSKTLSLAAGLTGLVTFMVWMPMIFGGFWMIAIAPLLLADLALLMMTLCFASACAIRVVTDSSEGSNEVGGWPVMPPTDWLGEAFYMAIALATSGIVGYLIGLGVGDINGRVGLVMLSVWALFPIMHLSTLEAASPWALLMPGVLGSLFKHFIHWLQLYVFSALLLGVVIGIAWVLGTYAPWAQTLELLVMVPLGVIYFRLLGRLAWRIRYDA